MRLTYVLLTVLAAAFDAAAAHLTVDLSSVKNGPITPSATNNSLIVQWQDGALHSWSATFSLDSEKPLITSIAEEGRTIVDQGQSGLSLLYRQTAGRMGCVL